MAPGLLFSCEDVLPRQQRSGVGSDHGFFRSAARSASTREPEKHRRHAGHDPGRREREQWLLDSCSPVRTSFRGSNDLAWEAIMGSFAAPPDRRVHASLRNTVVMLVTIPGEEKENNGSWTPVLL